MKYVEGTDRAVYRNTVYTFYGFHGDLNICAGCLCWWTICFAVSLMSLHMALALAMSGNVSVYGMDFCPDVVH